MPHLILEYSSNILEKNDLKPLFQQCHSMLSELLPTNIDGCKSRGIEYENYHVGDGNINNAFIHVTLKVMAGRPKQIQEKASTVIMELLQSYFKKSSQKLRLQITLEVTELGKIYVKVV